MADYISSENSIIGVEYLQGVVSGAEDYVFLPLDSYHSVALQGDFSKDVSNQGEIQFSGQRWLITRSSSNYSYSVDYTPSVECSISIVNPYYCRGSLSDMSVVSSRRAEVAGNFATISIMWGVILCVILSSIVRFATRSR